MAEALEFLINILCQQNTASYCQSFINSYPDPVQQIVFFVFFPFVFLILFVRVLSNGISSSSTLNDARMNFLISIALFLFIIFQGWYHIFLNISKFWFIAVILLGGFWAFIHRMGPASGSGGGGGSVSRGRSAVGDFISRKMRNVITEEEEDLRKKIEDRFRRLEGLLSEIEKSPRGSEGRRGAIMDYTAISTELERILKEYGEKGKIGMFDVQKLAKGYWDRYSKLTERFERTTSKD